MRQDERGHQQVPMRFVRPAPDLADIVACFRERGSPQDAPLITLALPARPELFIEFYLGAPYSARTARGIAPVPATVLVGPSTAYHTDIWFSGAVDTFTIKLQPSALHRLFGLPGQPFVDAAESAPAVDTAFDDLRAGLEDARQFSARVDVAQNWLRHRLAKARSANGIDWAARLIRRSAGQVDLDRLADRCGMGSRHFRRCFSETIGVSPKHYSRISRFNAALDFGNRNPSTRWTDVAQHFGYFDQSHLLRDVREFAHGTMLTRRSAASFDPARSVSSYFAR